MKAFLLAAGLGTRLRPYTDTIPKCLIPIHGRPLLEIWLDLLSRYGVSEVLINTHHHARLVDAYVDGYRMRSKMDIGTVYEPELLGSAGTLWRNRDFAAGESGFIVAYADNLTNLNLRKLVDFHGEFRSMGAVLTMGLFHASDPWLRGIAELDTDRRIVAFEEKPPKPRSDLANAGIYVADGDIFSCLKELACGSGKAADIALDLLPRLIGRMFGVPIEGYLQDIGTPQTYQKALAEWPQRENRNGI